MATRHADVFGALAAPIPANLVRKRKQSGRELSYITARVAMNRFDDVLGPENWRDTYTECREGLRCRIEVRLHPDGEWLWKEDGGGAEGMADNNDDEKSAYSSAFKRAAVKWGVGRELYEDGIASFAHPATARQAELPRRPERDLPEQYQRTGGQPDHRNGGGERKQFDGPPRNGKQLFAWIRKQEEGGADGLLKHLNTFAKAQGLPWKTVEYDEQQTQLAYAEAMHFLGESQEPAARQPERHQRPEQGEAYEDPGADSCWP